MTEEEYDYRIVDADGDIWSYNIETLKEALWLLDVWGKSSNTVKPVKIMCRKNIWEEINGE